MEHNDYIITSERVNKYLYSLGFDSKRVPDKTGKQKFIYLFDNTDKLHKALTFYTEFKKEV